MVWSRRFALSSLLFAAACASDMSPTSPPDGDAPPGSSVPMSTVEQRATALGVSIMSLDAGVPRLMRAIVPRAAAPGHAIGSSRRHVDVTVLGVSWRAPDPSRRTYDEAREPRQFLGALAG